MRVVKNPEERKREILKAAIHVFAQKGYDKTSISDIAAESGISQGLCYRYYSSKEEIYDAAVEELSSISRNVHTSFIVKKRDARNWSIFFVKMMSTPMGIFRGLHL